jgi:hypothetical protein
MESCLVVLELLQVDRHSGDIGAFFQLFVVNVPKKEAFVGYMKW